MVGFGPESWTDTKDTGQVSVGMVKAPGALHEMTATQHPADLYSLKEKPENGCVFSREDRHDCIRVDGGADEGPSHLEVQFRWTEWHLIEGREFTLVTTRNCDASCFNLVELQNGVAGRAHANLKANRFAGISARYKIGKERAQTSTTTSKKFGAYASDTWWKTYQVNMSLYFELVMKRSAIIPFSREKDPHMS